MDVPLKKHSSGFQGHRRIYIYTAVGLNQNVDEEMDNTQLGFVVNDINDEASCIIEFNVGQLSDML